MSVRFGDEFHFLKKNRPKIGPTPPPSDPPPPPPGDDFGGYRPQFLGRGTTTPGGRGGTLYRVNTLADNLDAPVPVGDGSFRCSFRRAVEVESGPRFVVFETSGYLTINSEVFITNPFLTIACQTAPSPGITFRMVDTGAPWAYIGIYTHDIVFQHMRVRPGDTMCNSGYQGIVGEDVFNIVFDHCSTSWGQDENMALGTPVDMTVWRCITSEALFFAPGMSGCTGGGDSAGSGMGLGASFMDVFQTIYAKNFTRNPQVGGNGAGICWINNLIYGWGSGHGFMATNAVAGEGNQPWHHTAIGNRFIVGPETEEPGFGATMFTYINNDTFPGQPGNEIYRLDNTFDDSADPGIVIPEFNALASGENTPAYDPNVGAPPAQAPVPADMVPMSSLDVEAFVKANAGARPLDRDAVDTRIINEITTRTGGFVTTVAEAGGYPTLAVNTQVFADPPNANDVAPGHEAVGRTNREIHLENLAQALEP